MLRTILALILLTAAALKGHQLATEPVAETGLLTSRWFLIGVVEFELFFGLWLSSGLYPRRTWQAALVCFSAFACISLYKALSGESSCGCFGRVPVNPWYTLILDLAAAAALVLCHPTRATATAPLPPAAEGSGVRVGVSPLPLPGEGPGVRAPCGARLGWVLGIFLAAGIPGAFAMGTYRPATLDASGDIFGDSQFVVLEPESWVGKRFPLLSHIDIGDELVKGNWIVVLYHHDCPACEEVIPKYRNLAREVTARRGGARIGLIEMAPYCAERKELDSESAPCRWGRLGKDREWLGAVPMEITLRQGVVAEAQPGYSLRTFLGAAGPQ